jgi:RimJ/RimL family protein N-acetyltransferase
MIDNGMVHALSSHVREAIPPDAAKIVAFLRSLHAETDFMLYEPGEFSGTEEQQARRIEEIARLESGIVFVCEADDEIVGAIFGSRGIARRTRHSLYIVIGVRQSLHGRGIGSALFQALEAWARSKLLHRLELTVDAAHQRAIALYEKYGYEREGVKRHSRKVDGNYSDELYMSKLI